MNLFNTLGYKSEQTNKLTNNTFNGFLEHLHLHLERINPKKSLNDKWKRLTFFSAYS